MLSIGYPARIALIFLNAASVTIFASVPLRMMSPRPHPKAVARIPRKAQQMVGSLTPKSCARAGIVLPTLVVLSNELALWLILGLRPNSTLN